MSPLESAQRDVLRKKIYELYKQVVSLYELELQNLALIDIQV